MSDSQERQQKKLKKLLEVAVKGEEAILDYIFEIEDKLDSIPSPEIPEKGEKGDKGDSYQLTDVDKKDIASLIEVPVVEKVIEKVIEKTEVIKEQPIINEVTKITNEIKEVAKSDTAEQIVEKINSTEKSIDFKTLKNYPDYSEEIKRLKTVINSTPAVTTSFINGIRAKNINFSGAIVSYKDDTATVTIPTTDLSGYVPYTGATSDVNLGTFGLIAHKIVGDATDGLLIETPNGTDIGILGPANTANVTWYGSHNFNTVTASRVAQFGASKTLESSSVTTTELGYLSGVTSAIQTQIDAKFTLPSLTSGSVLFSNGTTISQNNSNFFWDNTNIQLKIGSTSSANATTTNPLTVTKTSTSYVAVHIQNLSSGTAASTDLIIANNNDDGTVSTGKYLDAGINGDGYTGSGILNGAGDAYLYNNLEDLIIATGTAGKNVIIGTGGFGGTAASKTRATFTDTGLQMMNGSAANPSISFTGSTTTGFYQSATSTIGVSIAGTSRGTWGASTLSVNSSDGGTLDLGGTSQYMDFGGTIIPSANTFQTVRTATTWTPAVNRTSGFAFNNQFILGGTTTGLTLTTAVGNRSAILTAVGSSIGIAITNAYTFEARDFNNNSSGTVTATNLVGYYCNNLTFGTNNYGFQGAVSSGSNKYNLYMSGTAQNYLEGNLSVGISTASAKLHVVQTGTTTPVQQLSSTATNDDPTEITLQSRVATTNATVTTLGTIASATGFSYLIKSRVVARRTGGAGGAAGDYATYEITASANNEAGTLNIDAVTTTVVWEDQAGWDATIDASGTDIRIRVTGAASNNITWHATTMYYLLST